MRSPAETIRQQQMMQTLEEQERINQMAKKDKTKIAKGEELTKKGISKKEKRDQRHKGKKKRNNDENENDENDRNRDILI